MSEIASTDGTHKLIYEGYPIIISGIIDQSKAFHPTCFCFSTSESECGYAFVFETVKNYLKQEKQIDYLPEYLVADSAISITNGFNKVFKHDYVRINCWAHGERNVEDKMKKIHLDKDIRPALLVDIKRLQICKNETSFINGVQLFFKKWEAKKDKIIDEFLEYFQLEKMTNSPNWYEAAAQFVPSTSNGIESGNREIKDGETFRERWPIGRFMNKSLSIVRNWSKERKPSNINCKLYHTTPILDTKTWKNAYSWLKVYICLKSNFYYN